MDDGVSSASGTIRFALYDGNGAEIANRGLDAGSLVPLQPVILNVPDDVQVDKGTHTITLEAVDLVGTIGFAVRTPDRYPGAFLLSGEPFDGDLVFYYYCAPAGLFGY